MTTTKSQTLRIKYCKLGKIRFTSHRDTARMWERALRRAELPVAYTQGYSPRPRISFGLALPTCYESNAEYLDVTINNSTIDLTTLAATLSAALPVGIDVLNVNIIDPKEPSLQETITSCTWKIETSGTDASTLQAALNTAMEAESLLVSRTHKGRDVQDDIRPGVISVEIADTGTHTPELPDSVTLVAQLATKPRAIRPSDLLACLDTPVEAVCIRRLNQWTATGTEPPVAHSGSTTALSDKHSKEASNGQDNSVERQLGPRSGPSLP